MKTAKQNIAALPEQCFHITESDGKLIKIKAGESGFYKIGQDHPEAKRRMENITMDEFADNLNKELRVTKAQRQAMAWGSMFGWETRMADVEQYHEDGSFKNKEDILKDT